MSHTIDIFIPNKSKRNALGRYITAFKGLYREAVEPPPNNPRVKEHQQPIPRLRTPNEYDGAFIERYEEQEPCCDECDSTADAGEWEESKHPRGQPENKGEFAKSKGGGVDKNVPSLRPVVRIKGKDYIGEIGSTHVDIWDDVPKEVRDQLDSWDNKPKIGFYTENNKFLDREKAGRYALDFDLLHPVAKRYLSKSAKPELAAEHLGTYWERPRSEVLRAPKRTKDYSPYYAPVYTEVKPGSQNFEEIWEHALSFPERYEMAPHQLIPLEEDSATFVETEHPRGQPENKGEFVKKGMGNVGSQSTATERVAAFVSKRRGPDTAPHGRKPVVEPGASNTIPAGGGGAVTFSPTASPIDFYKTILAASQASSAGAAVHVYEPGEYGSMRCFLTPDKSAGFAIKNGDDIVSVFKHPNSPHKKVAVYALAEAVKQGGRRLDCFDTVLPGFYSNNHFRAVSRVPFNDEFAPEGWDSQRMAPFNQGRPDVVFMVHDPDYSTLYKSGDGQVAHDYDEAVAIQKQAVVQHTQQTAPTSRALIPSKPDRSDLPEHIKKLTLPPAWTNVHYHPNPDAELLAIGTDAAGRKQYVYSEKYASAQAAIKFARVRELEKKFAKIREHNEHNRMHELPVIRDVADATKLIMETGIRPGSDTDTKAKVKAYGATTLLGSHVQADVNGVSLKFTGKKGVPLDIPINDPETAEMLRYRAQRAGPNGKLFPSTDDKRLQGYIKQLSGGDFHPKDMRTYVANSTAMGAMRMLPQPKNMTQYKKQVHEVAKRVSRKLGNTPIVALASYINPDVFTPWRTGLQE